MLQHFRFKEQFLRRNKNAYISFISQELLDLIIKIEPKITYSQLQKKIYRLDLKNRTRQLRKLNATLLRETLPREVIDFLQGRIKQSVFLRYYYKPFLKDVRDRTVKRIKPLQKELLEVLS
jgi:intergrase/recombinase